MWEEGRTPPGCLPTTLGTNPPLPESWAPPPNRGTPLSEASSDPCMAVTERLPQRDHPWTQEGNPCALHRCFGVWLFCLLVPPFQQSTQENSFPTPGAAEAGGAGDRGSEKVERLGDARWEGASGWREWVWAEGESGGEGREGSMGGFLVQFSSVQSLSRVRLCDPMNRSTPGLPVRHQLSEFTQTHVHRDT